MATKQIADIVLISGILNEGDLLGLSGDQLCGPPRERHAVLQ